MLIGDGQGNPIGEVLTPEEMQSRQFKTQEGTMPELKPTKAWAVVTSETGRVLRRSSDRGVRFDVFEQMKDALNQHLPGCGDTVRPVVIVGAAEYERLKRLDFWETLRRAARRRRK